MINNTYSNIFNKNISTCMGIPIHLEFNPLPGDKLENCAFAALWAFKNFKINIVIKFNGIDIKIESTDETIQSIIKSYNENYKKLYPRNEV